MIKSLPGRVKTSKSKKANLYADRLQVTGKIIKSGIINPNLSLFDSHLIIRINQTNCKPIAENTYERFNSEKYR